MSDSDSELGNNPYLKSLLTNPPAPATRPINTNLDPNPYVLDRGTRPIRNQSRLGTYSPHSEADISRLGERASSVLVTAAIGASPVQKFRPYSSPLVAVHHAHDLDDYEPIQKSSKSNKRRYTHRESSGDFSEHEEDEFSPALKRQLASTPVKRRKSQSGSGRRHTQRYSLDQEHSEEVLDATSRNDKDAEEEEALEKALAQCAEHDRSSPSYATPTSKRRNRGGANTPVDRMLYPTPTGNSSNSLRKKPKGKPVPQDLNRADAADRMMFRWKSTGRPWEDIREEYYRLHGSKPAASSLSVRYIKLCENIAANGFKDENHASIFETYPDQKFLKTFAKADVQEVALTKAVSEAKIKLAPALWKEVVVQMKAFTGETFAAPSLRKRYEEIEKRQFYLSEQNPAKDNQWPPLSTSKNHHTAYFDFDDTPELLPVAVGDLNIADHDHGQNRRIRDMSPDTDSTDGDIDYVGRFKNGKGRKRSAAISDRKVKFEDTLRSRQEIEKENASPSHTHPSAVYSKIQHPVEASYDGFNNNHMGLSTPTPASAVGVALRGTGVGAKTSAGPRLGLVGYGDSDDSD